MSNLRMAWVMRCEQKYMPNEADVHSAVNKMPPVTDVANHMQCGNNKIVILYKWLSITLMA